MDEKTPARRRIRLSPFDALGVVAVIAMALSLAALVQRYEIGFGELQLELTQEDLEAGFREGFEYHSIYLRSAKVGTLRTERRRNGDGYHMRTEMDLSVATGAFEQRTRSTLDAFLDSTFRLESFHLEMSGGLLSAEIDGRWTGEAMLVTGIPGDAEARVFELPEPPLIMPSLRPVLMRRNLKPGDRVTFTYYDPMSQDPVTTDVAFIGREDIELMGQTVEAFHFEEAALGHRSNVWVNALGEVLIEEMPLGFRAVREPEAEARYGLRDSAAAGATERAPRGVLLEGVQRAVLGRPRWGSATLRMRGLGGLTVVVAGPGQMLSVDDGVATVEIEADPTIRPRAVLDSLEREQQAAFLVETLAMELTDPELRSLHRAVVDPNARADERLGALTHRVAKDIALSATAEPEVPETAAQVVRTGRGSALGKAHLLAALLRIDGTPARVTHGVVVVGEDVVQHVWVEAFLGGWVGVDPTLDQVPVDAGYLRLGFGGDMERLFARGALRGVEVLGVRGAAVPEATEQGEDR